MKVCKVKPDVSTCADCLAMGILFSKIENCSKCKLSKDEYELMQIGTEFCGDDYAMVLRNGKIKKVALNRVYDVKEARKE